MRKIVLDKVDTKQVDAEIDQAIKSLEQAKTQQVENAKAVQTAQKTLDDKNAAKQKMLGPDGEKADKEVQEAQAKVKEALAKKESAAASSLESDNNLKKLESARDAAKNALSAGTSSLPAQFFDARGSNYYDNSQNVQAVAEAVTEIVKTVTNQTFTTEVCLKAFFEDERIHLVDKAGALQAFCTDWMKDINRWKFENLRLTHGLLPDGIGTNPAFSKPTAQSQPNTPGPVVAPVMAPMRKQLEGPYVR